MTSRRLTEMALMPLVLAIGCTAGTAPARPSWDLDVQPLVRGSCGHCHGELAAQISPAFRFDVCDPEAMKSASGVDFGTDTVLGAASSGIYGLIVVDTDPSRGRPRMPPAPAGTLSDYDTTVLKNWAELVKGADNSAAVACKKQGSNHDPQAKLIGVRWNGSDLIAAIEISDSDGDQVFTKVTAGDASASLLSAGRHDVTLSSANMGDPITVKMSDGYNTPSEMTISK